MGSLSRPEAGTERVQRLPGGRRMSRWALWPGLVAAACGGSSRSGVRAVHGLVGVEPEQVDFGDVALGKESRTRVVLRNDGLVQAAVDATPASLASEGFEVVGLPVVLGP